MPDEVIEAPVVAAAPAAATAAAPAAAPAPDASALAKPVPLHERIPEKFHVKKGEEFDAEASMAKVLESYGQLEKRVGSGDAPPKAPEEYTITPPEALKDSWKEDEKTAAFRKDAHAAGLNQKQFDFVMGKYFATAGELAKGAVSNTVEAVSTALDKAWGADYEQHLTAAQKTFDAFATPEEKGKFDEIMTNPAIAYQMLARIAPELGEARGVPADAGGTGEDSIQQLLTSAALSDPKHPDHKATRAKVDGYYAKKYGTAPVS